MDNESKIIELPGTNAVLRRLEERVSILEQFVAQIDSNLAWFSLGASIVLEALRKLLIEKGIISAQELDEVVQKLSMDARKALEESLMQKFNAQQQN